MEVFVGRPIFRCYEYVLKTPAFPSRVTFPSPPALWVPRDLLQGLSKIRGFRRPNGAQQGLDLARTFFRKWPYTFLATSNWDGFADGMHFTEKKGKRMGKYIDTSLKPNMTLEHPPCSIGDTSFIHGGFSIVLHSFSG